MFSESSSISAWQVLSTTSLAYLIYSVANGLYNWYFHPLSKFPGPRWAAFSTWWKTNLEVFQGRNMVEELFRLHKIYGITSVLLLYLQVLPLILIDWYR